MIDKGSEEIDPRKSIVILSYAVLSQNLDKFGVNYSGKPWRCVIVDESHYIKNKSSKRSQAVQTVCAKAERVVLLSGTPNPNHCEELLHQLYCLWPVTGYLPYDSIKRYYH